MAETDIDVNRMRSGEHTNLQEHEALSFVTINCRSLQSLNKRDELSGLITEEDPDVICIVETWLTSEFTTSEVFRGADYTVYRRDRKETAGTGGGVAIAVRGNIVAEEQIDLETNCELMWIKVADKQGRPTYIGCYYRPPDCRPEPVEKLTESLEKLVSKAERLPHIVLTGDFNLPSICWSSGRVLRNPQYGMRVNNMMLTTVQQNHLEQINREATMKQGENINDLLCISHPDTLMNCETFDGFSSSDHKALRFRLTMSIPKMKEKPRMIYMWKRMDRIEISRRLQHCTMTVINHQLSVENTWITLTEAIQKSITECVPKKKYLGGKHLPYINRQIRCMCRKKKRLYLKAKKSQLQKDWEDYLNQQWLVKAVIRTSFNEYLNGMLEVDNTGTGQRLGRKFFKFIKQQRSDRVSLCKLVENGTEYNDAESMANILSRQYERVFTDPNNQLTDNLPSLAPSITNLEITMDGVRKLLRMVPLEKAAGPDKIPNIFIRTFADQLTPIVHYLYQRSLKTGEVPNQWKTAMVIPVYKKGNKADPSNYRPVSLTCVLCKIFEHILYKHVITHCESRDLIKTYQHGFRARHSCETQLINLLSDIQSGRDRGQRFAMIILDFSKAFDTVNHEKLLQVLPSYGIDGCILKWIHSWIMGRTQTVLLNGVTSDVVRVKSGVPQGSVLGPLMFLLYINGIGDCIQPPCKIRLFADDCILYRTVTSMDDHADLQLNLTRLEQWQNQWDLKFAPQKCYAMCLPAVLTNDPISAYMLNNVSLSVVNSQPYLGVHLQADLKWSVHINKVCAKSSSTLGFLRRNLHRCSRKIKACAYNTYILPQLLYGAAAYDPFTGQDINRLEMIQRTAARFCCHEYRRTPGVVSACLRRLGWDSLYTRRKVQRLCMLYDAIWNSLALEPHRNITQPCRHLLRFNHVKSRTSMYRNSFWPRTIREWNEVPVHIKLCRNRKAFREQLFQTLRK